MRQLNRLWTYQNLLKSDDDDQDMLRFNDLLCIIINIYQTKFLKDKSQPNSQFRRLKIGEKILDFQEMEFHQNGAKGKIAQLDTYIRTRDQESDRLNEN